MSDTPVDRIAELERMLAQREHELAQRDAKAKQDELRAAAQAHRITRLESFVRRLLRGRFIPSSEKTLIHDPGQLSLDFGPDGVALTDPPPPLAIVPDGTPGAGSPARRRRGRRRLLSAMYPELERVIDPHDLDPHERFDTDGTPLVRMGYEDAESLVWDIKEPYIRVTRRYRYGRPDTAEKVDIAPVPPRITPKGILADETIHTAVIHHVLDALPWHRQEIMSQRAGCRIRRSVFVNAFADWCDVMEPIARGIRAYVLAQPVIGADSTGMPHQDRRRPRRCSATALWGATDGQAIFFHWTADQRHARVLEVLGGYRGTVIRDEWDGWKKLLPPRLPGLEPPGPPLRMAGCHAHARRRFVDMEGVDHRADRMLRLYQHLYAVEQDAVERALAGEDLVTVRQELRSQRARAIWASILAQAHAIIAQEGPATDLCRAAQYIVTYERTLERYLDDGRIPIDNNGTENALRIVALLRKNRLFLGRSVFAGPRLAIVLTVLRSCNLAGINPATYLADVTPILLRQRDAGAAALSDVDLQKLLPHTMAGLQGARRLGSSSIARMA